MGSGIGEAADGIGAVRNLFGKKDKNATNDTLNSQVVATGTPGAKTVADPNQGLSGGQLAVRRGLMTGLGSMSQLGGQQAQPRPQQTAINFAPPPPQYQPPLKKYAGNPFFGQ